jgi:hypothetical protein
MWKDPEPHFDFEDDAGQRWKYVWLPPPTVRGNPLPPELARIAERLDRERSRR